jgi:hypothetical protein
MLPAHSSEQAAPDAPRRRFRKLRIAWSVGWSIICLLLIALWIRSYRGGDYLYWNYAYHRSIVVGSTRGQIVYYSGPFTIGRSDNLRFEKASEIGYEMAIRHSIVVPLLQSASFSPIRAARFPIGRSLALVVSHWFSALVTAVFSAAPLVSVVKPIQPPHTSNRHDAGCPGAGADRVCCKTLRVRRDEREVMSRIWIMIDVALVLIAVIATAAYWATKDEKAEKEGKPKTRRRIW